MIDRNVFLFKQIVFMFNFALRFGYGLCLSRRNVPNLPLRTLKQDQCDKRPKDALREKIDL